MSPFFTFSDVEMHADREADLEALFAELAQEDDELPPILQDEVPGDDWDTWGEAA